MLAGLYAEGILVARIAVEAAVGRPELIAPVVGGNVGSQSATVVLSRLAALPDDLTRGGIVDVPGVGALLLVNVEQFQSRAVWVEVGQVDGIAVAEADGVEHLAVIVEGG